MTDADKVVNVKHFGSDPADTWIRIRINREIWIRIPDHFWLRLDALAEVCALYSLVDVCVGDDYEHLYSPQVVAKKIKNTKV